MKYDKHTWIRAFRKVMHNDLIRGSEIVDGINEFKYRRFPTVATKYQILHMFLNAGISKKTLVITHHRQFTGRNIAYDWCSCYLRHCANRIYAQKHKEELKDKGIYPQHSSDVLRKQYQIAKKKLLILESKLQDI